MENKQIIIATYKPFRKAKTSGAFRCNVPPGTKGAVRLKTHNPNDKDGEADYLVADLLKGKLVWVDIQNGNFGYDFVVGLLNSKGDAITALRQSADCTNISDVMNQIVTKISSKGYENNGFTIEHNVWEHKTEKGDDGTPKIKANIRILDCERLYTKENPKPDTLKWVKGVNAKGSVEWDKRAETAFWHKAVKSVQMELVKNGGAIPFGLKRSVIAGIEHNVLEVKHDNAFIEQVKFLADGYAFKWLSGKGISGRGGTSSDDFNYWGSDLDREDDTPPTFQQPIAQPGRETFDAKIYGQPVSVAANLPTSDHIDPDDMPF